MSKITPVVNTNGSDSAMLDNTLEFFVMNGMPDVYKRQAMSLLTARTSKMHMDSKAQYSVMLQLCQRNLIIIYLKKFQGEYTCLLYTSATFVTVCLNNLK